MEGKRQVTPHQNLPQPFLSPTSHFSTMLSLVCLSPTQHAYLHAANQRAKKDSLHTDTKNVCVENALPP